MNQVSRLHVKPISATARQSRRYHVDRQTRRSDLLLPSQLQPRPPDATRQTSPTLNMNHWKIAIKRKSLSIDRCAISNQTRRMDSVARPQNDAPANAVIEVGEERFARPAAQSSTRHLLALICHSAFAHPIICFPSLPYHQRLSMVRFAAKIFEQQRLHLQML